MKNLFYLEWFFASMGSSMLYDFLQGSQASSANVTDEVRSHFVRLHMLFKHVSVHEGSVTYFARYVRIEVTFLVYLQSVNICGGVLAALAPVQKKHVGSDTARDYSLVGPECQFSPRAEKRRN